MTLANLLRVEDVRFEHYRPNFILGVDDLRPRLSWRVCGNSAVSFRQRGYEIEVFDDLDAPENREDPSEVRKLRGSAKIGSSSTQLVPWPLQESLKARARISVRIRVFSDKLKSTWSDYAIYEPGLVTRDAWHGERITSTQLVQGTQKSQQEHLFRRSFETDSESSIRRARLYIAVQGVYQAEVNGEKVSLDVLAPGWTVYDRRIRYQTYDVKNLLVQGGTNCIGITLADGWFCGRVGFFGGRRHRWGPYPTLLAQLEIKYGDGSCQRICSDSEWLSKAGPAYKAEIYDGEKYDSNAATLGWSRTFSKENQKDLAWEMVTVLSQLPPAIKLTAGCSEPVRPIETLDPIKLIESPSGKRILDFGQNFVGYIRLKQVNGQNGDAITLKHAEVLQNGELALRPLRICEAMDEFVCNGMAKASWEPRFTYHGLRYCQIDGWPENTNLLQSVQGVVCHNDFQPTGDFHCSNAKLNQLYSNAKWSMRGNFFSIPTDCPQRDERLGWTGDIALFAPTALKLYDCFGFLKDWLVDVVYDQERRGGVPAYVTPDMFDDVGIWSEILPVAVWHDVVILVPWALYEASGDEDILRTNYGSMKQWLETIPRDEEHQQRLWNRASFQLGVSIEHSSLNLKRCSNICKDWLDPRARPEQPMDGQTDPLLVANAFLIHSIDLMARVATILNYHEDAEHFTCDAIVCRQQFRDEYISPNGRLTSDSQTAYTLAIVFDLLQSPEQTSYAGKRLATILRRNNFMIGTGFAGTPFLLEALVRTGHYQVAYATLLCEECPSWLYPLKVGATTMWERWDSMLPNGEVNPGEMTSFNHYCFGSVVSFLCERLAGLDCTSPGWKTIRVAPQPGGNITSAQVKQWTPYGWVSVQWQLKDGLFEMQVEVPPLVTAEIVLPSELEETEIVGGGQWSFISEYRDSQKWPVDPITAFPKLV